MGSIDHKDIADRVVALTGMGVTALARHLGTTVRTLDRIVCHRHATEDTYARILPRLENLESAHDALKKERGEGDATLLALLNAHADETEGDRR